MNLHLNDKTILDYAKKITSKYNLCNHCLGRVFGKIEHGLSNKERGEFLRNKIEISKDIKINNCWLCHGLFNEIDHFSELIYQVLKDYEFKSFLIGSKIDEDIIDREKKLLDDMGDEYSEQFKTEVNREIGKILEMETGKIVDFDNPDIMVIIDTAFDNIKLQISSLFIYGRYNKYVRDLPQTIWHCRYCRGRGCRNCNYSGKLYDSSIQELLSEYFLKLTHGSDTAFHGSGREDIDVLMLGNGRPFVLEIKNPKIRNIDLSKIESDINSLKKNIIKVSNLRFSNRDEIVRIKNSSFNKVYRVVVLLEKHINIEKLKKASLSLRDKSISQFTPSRVAHRRANMVRERQIYSCNINSLKNNIATIEIEAESGTYIKELISSDDGRTRPSLSEITGIPCKVIELDVLEIKGE